jgi:hypothetical protein
LAGADQDLAEVGEVSNSGLSENEIVEAARLGVISVDDAMNRDF